MKFNYLIFLALYIVLNCSLSAQKRAIQEIYADEISAEELEEHLEILASDKFGGREAGTNGEKLAADYLKDHYEELGLAPVKKLNSYFQNIPLSKSYWDKVKFIVNNKSFTFLEDFYAFNKSTEAIELKTKEVLFAGYGISEPEYNNYKKFDAKGKVVVVLDGEPKDENGNAILSKTKSKRSEWSSNWRKKLIAAKQNEVAVLLIVKKNIESNIKRFDHSIKDATVKLKNIKDESKYAQNYYISEEMARSIIGDKYDKLVRKTNKNALKVKAKAKRIKSDIAISVSKKEKNISGINVFGFIEGSDLKDEYIVLTGHYDHLGIKGDKIYNGADDNGTGTVALMEIAESFAKAKADGHGPRRSVVIFNNSAEEKGLLGSKHYVENPVFPLEKTVACLNIDMIGRIDDAHKAINDENYVYIIGSDFLSTDLHKINEMANNDYAGINLDYKFNNYSDPNRFYFRSDHYNFVEKGIPSIFYFSGVHKDYHKHTDTEDKIIYKKSENIAKLIFHTAWLLANRDEKIKVDVVPPAINYSR